LEAFNCHLTGHSVALHVIGYLRKQPETFGRQSTTVSELDEKMVLHSTSWFPYLCSNTPETEQSHGEVDITSQMQNLSTCIPLPLRSGAKNGATAT
jgi:hypothetical protein